MREQTKKIQIGRNKKSDHNIDQQHRKGTLRTNKWIKSMHINYYLRWQYAKQTSTLLDIAFVCGVVCCVCASMRKTELETSSSLVHGLSQWTIVSEKRKRYPDRRAARLHCCTLFIYCCIWLFFTFQQKVEISRPPNWTSLDFICVFFFPFVCSLFACLAYLPISSQKLFAFIICCCFIMIHK